MKVILQDYEPKPVFGATDSPKPVVRPGVRKLRLRLNPVQVETRLFHAL